MPSFFFSHAGRDRRAYSRKMLRFFGDLKERVEGVAGMALNEISAVLDTNSVDQGENFDAKLGGLLGVCKAFIAMYTPGYFNRPDCGREMFLFIKRTPGLKLDADGRLMNARNIVPIQWLPGREYVRDGVDMAVVPKHLNRISYNLSNSDNDPQLRIYIENYRKNGMESFVGNPKSYPKLLSVIATHIVVDLPPLPEKVYGSFQDASNGFSGNCNWEAEIDLRLEASAHPAAAPEALNSVVAFYLTDQPRAPSANTFVDGVRLIKEPDDEPATPFGALIRDVRAAGMAERFSVFHADGSAEEHELSGALQAMSKKRKLITMLVIDPKWWTGARDEIVTSLAKADWVGPLAFPLSDAGTQNAIQSKLETNGIIRTAAMLPLEDGARVQKLRSVFVAERASIRHSEAPETPVAPAPFPSIRGPGAGKN